MDSTSVKCLPDPQEPTGGPPGPGPPVRRLLRAHGRWQAAAGVCARGLSSVPTPPPRGGAGSTGRGPPPTGPPAPRSPGCGRASDWVAANGGARPRLGLPWFAGTAHRPRGDPRTRSIADGYRGRLQISSQPAAETHGVRSQSHVHPPGTLGLARCTRRWLPPFTRSSAVWWPHDTGRTVGPWRLPSLGPRPPPEIRGGSESSDLLLLKARLPGSRAPPSGASKAPPFAQPREGWKRHGVTQGPHFLSRAQQRFWD